MSIALSVPPGIIVVSVWLSTPRDSAVLVLQVNLPACDCKTVQYDWNTYPEEERLSLSHQWDSLRHSQAHRVSTSSEVGDASILGWMAASFRRDWRRLILLI